LAKHDEIFDAHTAPTGNINSRLDGEQHVGFDFVLAGLARAWKFVDDAPDPVPQTVPEILTKTGLFDDPAREAVYLFALHPRARLALDRQLRLEHGVVYLAELVGGVL